MPPLPALTPVERRRRRRRRRRLLPLVVLLLVLALAGLGAWLLWPGGGSRTTASDTSGTAAATKATGAAGGAAAGAGSKQKAAAAQKAAVTARTLVVAKRQPQARITPPLTSRSAIVIDGHTGEVVFWKKPHARVPIASVTKVMTVLLALESLKPYDIVTVTPEAARVPPNREGLRPGEQVEAFKLMYASMLYSGNDSALALAVAVGGTRARFVAMMNARAKALELVDTHFNSVSGVVDEDNYSSAWDMAALARVAMTNPRFRTIVGTPRKRVDWAPPTDWKLYVNHNRLLTTYDGADGIKTGWTTAARHTLVASARRGKTWLIGVTLGSAESFTDMRRLLDLGFRKLGT